MLLDIVYFLLFGFPVIFLVLFSVIVIWKDVGDIFK